MIALYAVLAAVLAFVLTPVSIALAVRMGAVDVPADGRRMHRRATPRAGGIAIFLAFCIAYAAWGDVTRGEIAAWVGAGAIFLLGLVDDVYSLPAGAKLILQAAWTVAAVAANGSYSGFEGVFAVLWVVALTNAHNFIDGLDGLFAGCAAIEGAGLFATLLAVGAKNSGAAPLLLALACLGFLPHNQTPAKSFAGDCGSCTVGFLLGMLSLPLFGAGEGYLSFLSPFLLFAYPLTDLLAAVLRRVLRGKSPFCADRGHLHHRIFDAGVPASLTVWVLRVLSVGTVSLSVLILLETAALYTALFSFLFALLLVEIRRFIEKFT